MKMTQLEMVTREYCDECGIDMHNMCKHGTRSDDTQPWHIVCGKCYSVTYRTEQQLQQKGIRNGIIQTQPFF